MPSTRRCVARPLPHGNVPNAICNRCEVPFFNNMHHMIVKKNVTSVFKRLNKGDYEYALSGIGTTIEHRFAGEHSKYIQSRLAVGYHCRC
jgi:hypothetical protein